MSFGAADRGRDGGADQPNKNRHRDAALLLHRPVRVAEDVAVLDNIANGRFILGVAAGYRPIEFEGLGEGRKGREARMEEQLRISDQVWDHGFVRVQRKALSVSGNFRDAHTCGAEAAPANLDRRLDRGRLSPRGQMGGRAMFLAAAPFERPQKSLRELSALPERVRA